MRLLFLEFARVHTDTRAYFLGELRELAVWMEQNRITLPNPPRQLELDLLLLEYLDHPFFEGHQVDKGNKVLAAVGHIWPLPSDLRSITRESLVPPQVGTTVRWWALVLYLQEMLPRGKMVEFD